jgi:hypothetical protein
MGNPMQRANEALEHHPRCGAYARTTGQPCKGWAMANGRCRMHGGKAGRKSTHGRYTRAAIERRQGVRDLLRVLSELVGQAGRR